SVGVGVNGVSEGIGVEGYSSGNVGIYGSASGSSLEGSNLGSAGVWGDTGNPLYVGVLGTADDSLAGYFANNSSAAPTILAENSNGSFGAVAFQAYLDDVGTYAIIADPGCNPGFIALALGQAEMTGCSNYTLAGGTNGNTYINAPSGGAVHLRINSVEQLAATSGNVSVYGTFSATGTKNFRIDHPLDPANKYLFHASVESSEVLNLYSGNAVLDASGEAVVQLPDWFEVINKDFRYQLTSIGAPGRDLYVAEEVSGGHFKIAGGRPGGKVSWQVSGAPDLSAPTRHTRRGRGADPKRVGAGPAGRSRAAGRGSPSREAGVASAGRAGAGAGADRRVHGGRRRRAIPARGSREEGCGCRAGAGGPGRQAAGHRG